MLYANSPYYVVLYMRLRGRDMVAGGSIARQAALRQENEALRAEKWCAELSAAFSEQLARAPPTTARRTPIPQFPVFSSP